jgi:hypothetical protein
VELQNLMPFPHKYMVMPENQQASLPKPWSDPVWNQAGVLEVAHFRPESSAHRPATQARLLYNAHGLCGIFRVRDQFVRAVRADYQSEVWKDSCVEFFVQPKITAGYFNFEMNCGGTLLCSYITDPTRLPGGALKEFVRLPADLGRTITVHSTLPKRIEPEIADPIAWELCFFIPFAVLETFIGPLGNIPGQTWRGNFYKCAEDNSHPHWASWSPVDEFNFHLPECFGSLEFK